MSHNGPRQDRTAKAQGEMVNTFSVTPNGTKPALVSGGVGVGDPRFALQTRAPSLPILLEPEIPQKTV